MAHRAVDEEPATRIGNDDDEFDGDLTVAIEDDPDGSRHAYFVPRPLRNATPDQRAVMREIQDVVRANMAALVELDRQVELAREVGLSWGSIGWLTGMSGRGAQKRWDVESGAT